jgi:hypothetical protein
MNSKVAAKAAAAIGSYAVSIYVTGYSPAYRECLEQQLCTPTLVDPIDAEQNGSPHDEPIRSMRLSTVAARTSTSPSTSFFFSNLDRSG